ncbi:hypothetical protein LSH36_484g04038 [Paralvinella palmiformis]|uniref:Uncharacterized protein n=1 Tax=Paralvinella palmiformis TaxID=53620 RepID=A0AAD9J9N0_9ANNE|nr:hypothetical protein LSH36_484g04038 [Paralvinella palmiformis]
MPTESLGQRIKRITRGRGTLFILILPVISLTHLYWYHNSLFHQKPKDDPREILKDAARNRTKKASKLQFCKFSINPTRILRNFDIMLFYSLLYLLF